jgi:hypothetical protein
MLDLQPPAVYCFFRRRPPLPSLHWRLLQGLQLFKFRRTVLLIDD